VTIGPVASASVRAWANAARETLAIVRARDDLGVTPDVLSAFDAYVETWAEVGEAIDPFVWTGEIDSEMLRRLAAQWARLVTLARTDPASGLRPGPPEGEEFYNALTIGILEASAIDDREGFSAKFEEVVPPFAFDAPVPRRTGARRVLLVDDNDDIRLLMRLAIERDPRLEVCGEAAHGAAAVAACDGRCPDAVLLDLMMPVMDGWTALPLLKERCPDTDVVVFSAAAAPDVRARALSMGAAAVFGKTDDTSTVLEALAGAV
jgi:CheY-like chemotaxis protein